MPKVQFSQQAVEDLDQMVAYTANVWGLQQADAARR